MFISVKGNRLTVRNSEGLSSFRLREANELRELLRNSENSEILCSSSVDLPKNHKLCKMLEWACA